MGDKDRKIIIAIDGFSSCGKSTFAKEIAAKIGYIFIDTGAMYRAVTLYGIRNAAISNTLVDEPKLVEMLDKIDITFRFNKSRGASDLYLNGENVESAIRGIEVSNCVSDVSAIAQVRTHLVHLQQQMGCKGGIVMDGRDIGTVVFPKAELKIYMTADPKIRAERRYKELIAKGENISIEDIEANIRKRDTQDQQRAISPLRRADDALELDNSNMSVEQQMDWVMDRISKLI